MIIDFGYLLLLILRNQTHDLIIFLSTDFLYYLTSSLIITKITHIILAYVST